MDFCATGFSEKNAAPFCWRDSFFIAQRPAIAPAARKDECRGLDQWYQDDQNRCIFCLDDGNNFTILLDTFFVDCYDATKATV